MIKNGENVQLNTFHNGTVIHHFKLFILDCIQIK